MTFRLCVLVVAGTIGAGCDGTPVQPLTPPQSSSSPIVGPHVTGVVRDDRGHPIAGATVTGSSRISVLTNEAGQFDVPVAPVLSSSSAWITASKAGYEQDVQYTRDATRNLTLHDIIRVRLGQPVGVTVRPDDAHGGLDDEYRIRVIRVFVIESTTVALRLVAEDGGPTDLWVRNSPCCDSITPVVVKVAGGTELVVEIRIPWTATESRTFTLITWSLE